MRLTNHRAVRVLRGLKEVNHVLGQIGNVVDDTPHGSVKLEDARVVSVHVPPNGDEPVFFVEMSTSTEHSG